MRKPKKEIQLTSYDELLGINEAEQNTLNQIVEVPLNELHPFRNHPFHVNDDEKMAETVESIKNYGILNPALVRPRAEGGYELIAGHRRKRGCELAGKSKMPVLIRNYTDDEAVIVMVDSNIQRESLLPSEKAYAYKMKMDAMKRQGKRTDLTCPPVVEKLNGKEALTASAIGNEQGDSHEQVRRYIRLNELVPELLEMVDRESIAFRPAVELSYLSEDEQRNLVETIDSEEATPSLSQAIRMKKLSQEGKLDMDKIFSIMTEEKPNQAETVKFKSDELSRFFPERTPPELIRQTILKLLDAWQKSKTPERPVIRRNRDDAR